MVANLSERRWHTILGNIYLNRGDVRITYDSRPSDETGIIPEGFMSMMGDYGNSLVLAHRQNLGEFPRLDSSWSAIRVSDGTISLEDDGSSGSSRTTTEVYGDKASALKSKVVLDPDGQWTGDYLEPSPPKTSVRTIPFADSLCTNEHCPSVATPRVAEGRRGFRRAVSECAWAGASVWPEGRVS